MTDCQKPNAPTATESSDDTEPPGAIAYPVPDTSNTSITNTKTSHKTAGKPSGKSAGKSAATTGCKVRVRFQTDDCTPPLTRWLKEEFLRLAELAKVTKGDITIVIVADEQMAQMHEQYTGVKGTTDVLTFDHRDDTRQAIESDLVICVDTARREAATRGHDTRVEILLYALHGLNHLLGGDDHTPAGAKAMHRWEDQILTAAGFGAVFNQPTKTDTAVGRNKPASRRTASSASRKKTSTGKSGQSERSANATKTGTSGAGDPRRWSNRKAKLKKNKRSTHHPT